MNRREIAYLRKDVYNVSKKYKTSTISLTDNLLQVLFVFINIIDTAYKQGQIDKAWMYDYAIRDGIRRHNYKDLFIRCYEEKTDRLHKKFVGKNPTFTIDTTQAIEIFLKLSENLKIQEKTYI